MFFKKTGIFEYFAHGYRLWDFYFFTKKEDLIPVGTKVVVLQLYELQLGVQYLSDQWWSKFDQDYKAAEDRPLPDKFSKGAGIDGFVAPLKPLN
ncbi:MAG: hypothetical protein HQK86_14740 [Nitrospinae bacterium]|nr:hypothetical protein [Nitrospinota bacterium]